MKIRILPLMLLCFLALAACNGNKSQNEPEAGLADSVRVAPPATNYDPMKSSDTTEPMHNTASSADGTVTPSGVDKTVNELEDSKGNKITATYLSQGGMKVVKLQQPGEKEITLMQTEASAKAASYTNGKITWNAAGNEATFKENGASVRFSVKK